MTKNQHGVATAADAASPRGAGLSGLSETDASPKSQDRHWRPMVRGFWCWLASAGSVLAAVGSIIGLAHPHRIYGQETEALQDAVAAQDLVNLALVAPLLLLLGWGPSVDTSARIWCGWAAWVSLSTTT